MRRSNYEKFPVVQISDSADAVAVGWDAIGARLREAVGRKDLIKTVIKRGYRIEKAS